MSVHRFVIDRSHIVGLACDFVLRGRHRSQRSIVRLA